LGQFAQHALAVRAFRHVLDISGLDGVSELLLEIEPALVVPVVPAIVVDGADIHEPDLEGPVLGQGSAAEQRQGRRGTAQGKDVAAIELHHHVSPDLTFFGH
jgi:hypothetical protein